MNKNIEKLDEKMIHYIILVNRESGIMMFEKKLSEDLTDIKSVLLSGMLIALRQLSAELKIGELSTFNTHNKKVLTSVTKRIIVALIIDPDDIEKKFEKLSIKIGEIFEERYDIENWNGDVDLFDPFHENLDLLLKEFEWKRFGPVKSLKSQFILGFVLYENTNKTFYDFTSNKFDALKLIKEAETRNERKIRIDKKNEIYFFIKNESEGGIVIFESRAPTEKVNRYSKTFSFLIQNLNNSYLFETKLLKSAQKLFSPEIIDLIMQNVDKPLLDIFNTSEDPLNLIENIRKFKVRVLINFKE